MKPAIRWPALGLVAALAGCGGLFQTREVAPVVYTLRAAPPAAAPATLAATLVVARPLPLWQAEQPKRSGS